MTKDRVLRRSLIAACVFATPLVGLADDDDRRARLERKVELCHVPPGNPENPRTITVSERAVPAHLDHHPCDHLGACGPGFPNGVASGDVDPTSVVLWARGQDAGPITFEYGTSADFSGQPVGVETLTVDDPSVPAKLDVSGLEPGTDYFYRACRGPRCQGECPVAVALGSEVRGKFRTPHASGRHGLRFGVSSCWRGDLKPFFSIRNAPARDLDFFVALGDTTYADSNQTGPRVTSIRNDTGALHWGTVLNGYRRKNECQYRESSCVPGDDSVFPNPFTELRASTAHFATIDDHEVVNDFAGGADPRSQRSRIECTDWGLCFCPDDDTEGDCDKRYINDTSLFEWGLQAFQEYNPIRDEWYGGTGDSRTARERKLYRHRAFGRDAAIFMLDTRSFRDQPIDIDGIPVAPPPLAHQRNRTMLGSEQLTDLLRDLRRAERDGITWKFVLVPEPIQELGWLLVASDRFEGYARERGQILDFIQSFCISNVVFISGDIHASLANNLLYKKRYLEFERYSEAWDVSTGSVSYPDPYAGVLVDLLNAQLAACEGDPICESALPDDIPGEGFELLPVETQNAIATGLLDFFLTLFERPTVGLGPELIYPEHLQKRNAIIPATLLEGPYSNLATWGWSEFEIDEATQALTVTTYGVDPNASPDTSIPVWSRFRVDPVRRSGNGAACLADTDCRSCRCSALFECVAGRPNGETCLTDDQCASDRCSALGLTVPVPRCQAKRGNGAICLNDDDCLSGDCAADGLSLRCHPLPDGRSSRTTPAESSRRSEDPDADRERRGSERRIRR